MKVRCVVKLFPPLHLPSTFSILHFLLSLALPSPLFLVESNCRLFMTHRGMGGGARLRKSLMKRSHIQPVWTVTFKDRLWKNVKNSNSHDSYYCNLWRADGETIILSTIKHTSPSSIIAGETSQSDSCGRAHTHTHVDTHTGEKHTSMLHLSAHTQMSWSSFVFTQTL